MVLSILKVETDIITSIHESPIGRAVILVIMYAETFKTGVIAFISCIKCSIRTTSNKITWYTQFCFTFIFEQNEHVNMKVNLLHAVWYFWVLMIMLNDWFLCGFIIVSVFLFHDKHFDITIDLIGWSPNWAVRLIYSCKVLQSYLQVCGIYNKINTKKYERRFKCLH
jgi:hypothetical protein